MIETRDPLPGFEERLLAELLELVGDRDAPERRRRRRPMRRRWTFAAAAAAALAIGIGLPAALPTGSPAGPTPPRRRPCTGCRTSPWTKPRRPRRRRVSSSTRDPVTRR